jgi:hypothetical protein
VFIGWTAIGLGWYFFVRLRKPQVVANAAAWGEHAGEHAAVASD